MSLLEFAQTLYDSEFGTGLRESVLVFPIIEGLHLICLAFSVGLIFFVDLRLLGWFLPKVPVHSILQPLRPWLFGGFALTLVTGVALFIATAVKVIVLPVFFYKLGFIVLAGVNAAWFEYRWGRRIGDWSEHTILPNGVRRAGWASLALWSLAVVTGRLIPYLSYQ
ncbi:DUF6644 family protein [Methylomonas koyamae]|uniref:DUF6644 family protein n=1 Tax=Methylomonas koyamae TaxID=702114 RepID=UPI000BC338C5|nr:DUF6644 family protein [Methylomonas koyamae]ATG89815.1 hypothetical protein MKLM6_1569 [Methylomonas koyamae]